MLILFSASPCLAADVRKDCQARHIDSCTQILQSAPSDFNALGNRGIAFRVSGEYDRAIADLDAAIRINPDIAGLYLERGLAYDAKGEHLLAIRDFDEAIGRQPDLVQAHFGRAIAHQAVGQRDLSTVDIDSAMRLDRILVAGLYMQRGNQLRAIRHYGEAIAAFDRAIDINAGWPLAWFGRAASFEEMGNSERAAADYRKCIELTAKSDLERQRQQEARARLDRLAAR
ncbi:tetratricopeptide repeat protein [Bradyrhizobium sp. LjRoot220]|uniref:tetratricopeptide repeat protein n=1 Tax=Bradyrhizobium sp. LjRoot220 TaxID=3342284 RepID=UPI003ECE277D